MKVNKTRVKGETMDKEKTVFETLYEINVSDRTEKKNGLTYLSWANAWAEAKKLFPNANYDISTFGENHLPYVYDEKTGYMVFTSVTINEITHEMWLPVMDNSNKAMKSDAYTYDTKWKKGVRVEAATMFDINNAIMRCLVKNLAMFGLGLYIYTGEDLPESETNTEQGNAIQEQDNTPWQTGKLRDTVAYEVDETNKDARKLIIKIGQKYPDKSEKLISNICEKYGVKTIFELTDEQMKEVKEKL